MKALYVNMKAPYPQKPSCFPDSLPISSAITDPEQAAARGGTTYAPSTTYRKETDFPPRPKGYPSSPSLAAPDAAVKKVQVIINLLKAKSRETFRYLLEKQEKNHVEIERNKNFLIEKIKEIKESETKLSPQQSYTISEAERAIVEAKRAIVEAKRAIVEDKRAIVGAKRAIVILV